MTRSLECESTTARNDKFLELSTKHNIIFVKKFTHANNNFLDNFEKNAYNLLIIFLKIFIIQCRQDSTNFLIFLKKLEMNSIKWYNRNCVIV